jgi:hypothetical protein
LSGLIASGLKLSMACHQRIPNLIHFCYGLCENPPFGFLEYLAIKSAIDLNQPDAVFFHHKYLPSGTWWESIRPLLTLVAVDPPTEIFGNRIWHHAHQADVIRLNALIEHGGIYLDIDTLCVRSFDDLRGHKCVMGKQSEKRGLCNAVILAEPQSAFLRAWLDRYRDFDPDEWDEHSVQLPMTLAQSEQLIDKIHVLDVDRFFFPDWEHMDALFESQDQALFSNSYCIHYWASITGKRWLNRATLASIYARDTNFSIMARRHLLNSNADALSK